MWNTTELIDGYDANQALRGLSDQTRRRRRWTLDEFATLLGHRGRDLATATMSDVERLLAGRGSFATRKAMRGDLGCFYRWAIARKILQSDPTIGVDLPRVKRRHPTPLSRADLDLAVRAAHPRLRAMVMLGAWAGLRVSEIATLRWADVDTARSVVVVRHGKGDRDRIVPLHAQLAAALDVLPRRRDGRVIGTSGQNVSNLIRDHFARLSIDHRPHDLRATFATEAAAQSGGNLVVVAGLLGHASTQTTLHYCAWAPSGRPVVEQLYAA